ncbi:MAG: hypothetical protein AAF404_13825, partial [Pseudomonadota bacterium]
HSRMEGPMAKRRNPVVRHATILRKGGVHGTPKSSRKRQHLQALNDQLDDYFEQKKRNEEGAESDCPDHFCYANIAFTTSSIWIHNSITVSDSEYW